MLIPSGCLVKQGALYIYQIRDSCFQFELRRVVLHRDGRLTAALRVVNFFSGERLPVSRRIDLADWNSRAALARELEELASFRFWSNVLEEIYVELEDLLLAESSGKSPGAIPGPSLKERILELLAEKGGAGLRPREIAELLGVKEASVRVRLGELARAGQVLRRERGLYTLAPGEGSSAG